MGKIEKIKLKNFKSFKNSIIPVIDGFTTIVGSNGSGKSNLLDAIIFVLGTNSMKTLRAGRLTDLVHNSMKNGEAEVTIELRDGDKKFAVTRSIDKNGTSVFRIDDKRTTRMEIVELLATLNVPPEGHNLIMQGDVMNIINMTPKQRREVIDDISGIAEYNLKKEKAMKELEKVERKIKEANIILYERKGYLNELRNERNQALRYKKYEEKKKQLKHAIITREIKGIKEEYDKIIEEVTKGKLECDELTDKITKINRELGGLQQKLEGLNKEISAKGEKEQMDLHREIEQIKSSIHIHDERVKDKNDEINKKQIDISAMKKELSEIEEDSQKKQKSLSALQKEKQAYDERVTEKKKELEDYMKELKEKNLLVGDITEKLESMNNKITKQKEDFYKLKGEVDQAREKISIKKLSISDEEQEHTEKSEKAIFFQEQFDKNNRDYAKTKREVKGLENDLEEIFKKEKEKNKEIEIVENSLEDSREKYHSLQSKVTTIRHMTGNSASDSILSASKHGDLKGILGKIEDLCSFDVVYANAIQTSAGNRMHFIVTKDSESATQAIKWLKEKKLGRTTFIPLDKIKYVDVSSGAKKALQSPGAVDLAIKLVSFKPEYQNAFSYVFGDTVIVENIEYAKAMGFGTCRMATLDGDLAESSGAVTGGHTRGTLTMQEIKKVDEYKDKIEKLEKKKERLMGEMRLIREQGNVKRSEKADIELKMKEQEVIVSEMKTRLEEYQTEHQKHETKSETAKNEIEELNKFIRENDVVLKEKNSEIKTLEEQKEDLKEKMDSPETKKVSEKLDEMQKKVQVLNDQRAEIVIQFNSLDSEISKINIAKKNKLMEDIEKYKKGISELREEIERSKKEQEEEQRELKEKVELEKQLSSSIKGLIEEREKIEKEVRVIAEDRGMIQRQLEVKKQKYNDNSIQKARLETKYNDLKVEYDDKEEIIEFEMTVSEMKEEIQSIGSKMIKLEPINLKSIEMYERYLNEVESMKEKAKKLTEEKQSVLDLMEEIEKRRVETFRDAYLSIKENFAETYKQFYPEAREKTFADIKLENEEGPFSGGLLIEARPAGKPVKNIDSMSGGEKTLTALAFLFAIQAYKPSPFYILDEADAALDKPNSKRFAEMIKNKSSRSQFIVITHNDSMIQICDQIVGVSMNKEKGSSIVEVDLKRLTT